MNIHQQRFVEIAPHYSVWTLEVNGRQYCVFRHREERSICTVDHYSITRAQADPSESGVFWVELFHYLGTETAPYRNDHLSVSALSKRFDDGVHALFAQTMVFNDD